MMALRVVPPSAQEEEQRIETAARARYKEFLKKMRTSGDKGQLHVFVELVRYKFTLGKEYALNHESIAFVQATAHRKSGLCLKSGAVYGFGFTVAFSGFTNPDLNTLFVLLLAYDLGYVRIEDAQRLLVGTGNHYSMRLEGDQVVYS